jgi:hypothetical protein
MVGIMTPRWGDETFGLADLNLWIDECQAKGVGAQGKSDDTARPVVKENELFQDPAERENSPPPKKNSNSENISPGSDNIPICLLMELQKKHRAVIRKSEKGATIHVHDLKLCLDLFRMETQCRLGHGLQTLHVESAMNEQSVIEGTKLKLTPACILELKSWRTFFNKNRKAHRNRAPRIQRNNCS